MRITSPDKNVKLRIDGEDLLFPPTDQDREAMEMMKKLSQAPRYTRPKPRFRVLWENPKLLRFPKRT